MDDIAWYITSKAPFNTEYGIVEFFDFTEYVMSSLSIIGELISVAPEIGSGLSGWRRMVRSGWSAADEFSSRYNI